MCTGNNDQNQRNLWFLVPQKGHAEQEAFIPWGLHFRMIVCSLRPSLVAYLLVARQMSDGADLDENGPLCDDQGARRKFIIR